MPGRDWKRRASKKCIWPSRRIARRSESCSTRPRRPWRKFAKLCGWDWCSMRTTSPSWSESNTSCERFHEIKNRPADQSRSGSGNHLANQRGPGGIQVRRFDFREPRGNSRRVFAVSLADGIASSRRLAGLQLGATDPSGGPRGPLAAGDRIHNAACRWSSSTSAAGCLRCIIKTNPPRRPLEYRQQLEREVPADLFPHRADHHRVRPVDSSRLRHRLQPRGMHPAGTANGRDPLWGRIFCCVRSIAPKTGPTSFSCSMPKAD